MSASVNDTPAARTLTRTSPGPGRGLSSSTTLKTSGPPKCSTTTRSIGTPFRSIERQCPPRASLGVGPFGPADVSRSLEGTERHLVLSYRGDDLRHGVQGGPLRAAARERRSGGQPSASGR